jgi:hypothetical protein
MRKHAWSGALGGLILQHVLEAGMFEETTEDKLS